MSDHPQYKAVSSLLHRLSKKFALNWVHDGDEIFKLSTMKVSDAKKECIETILSVDDSHFNVKNKETGKHSTLYIVLGNDNSEIVCDYTDGDDDLDTIISQHSEYWENK